MTDTPLVSIIIPCFNYGRYVAEAIESALAQTYQPIEVIVIDDGSTDDSVAVAQRYPVVVLSQDNQGLSVTSNKGVRAARGEFVVRLDADDVLYPDFVAETVAALQQNPKAVLAHTAAEYFGERQGRVPFQPFDAEALAQGAYATGTALFRRSEVLSVGGFDDRIPVNEDWDLWLTFAERGMAGVMVPHVLWGYRQHGPSMVKRRVRSASDIRRELRVVSRLQDNHPQIFAPRHLVRRLRTLPSAVASGQIAPRIAGQIVVLYGIMLLRVAMAW